MTPTILALEHRHAIDGRLEWRTVTTEAPRGVADVSRCVRTLAAQAGERFEARIRDIGSGAVIWSRPAHLFSHSRD